MHSREHWHVLTFDRNINIYFIAMPPACPTLHLPGNHSTVLSPRTLWSVHLQRRDVTFPFSILFKVMSKPRRYVRGCGILGISVWCPDILVGAQGPSTYSREETRQLYPMGSGIYTSMWVIVCLSPSIFFPINWENVVCGLVLNQVALSRKSPYVETAHKVCDVPRHIPTHGTYHLYISNILCSGISLLLAPYPCGT